MERLMAEANPLQRRTVTILARLLLAPVLAPIAASIIVAVVAGGLVQSSLRETMNMAGLMALWAIPITLVVGMSWHALAYHYHWRGLLAYLMPGLTFGLTVPVTVLAPFGLVGEFGIFVALAGAVGGLTGIVFWLIRRPDRDPPSSSSGTRGA